MSPGSGTSPLERACRFHSYRRSGQGPGAGTGAGHCPGLPGSWCSAGQHSQSWESPRPVAPCTGLTPGRTEGDNPSLQGPGDGLAVRSQGHQALCLENPSASDAGSLSRTTDHSEPGTQSCRHTPCGLCAWFYTVSPTGPQVPCKGVIQSHCSQQV